MPSIFVDTAHHIAVFNGDDPLHDAAVAVASDLSSNTSVSYFTTHLVLAEFLASASRARHLRVEAANYVSHLILQENLTVVDITRPLFERALDLYRKRPDKSYSLADCLSMVVCLDLGITDVLTSDHDFEQEGFTALLRPSA